MEKKKNFNVFGKIIVLLLISGGLLFGWGINKISEVKGNLVTGYVDLGEEYPGLYIGYPNDTDISEYKPEFNFYEGNILELKAMLDKAPQELVNNCNQIYVFDFYTFTNETYKSAEGLASSSDNSIYLNINGFIFSDIANYNVGINELIAMTGKDVTKISNSTLVHELGHLYDSIHGQISSNYEW